MSRQSTARGISRAVAVMTGASTATFRGAVVLGYHDVQPEQQITTEYTVTPELLRYQITTAQKWGVRFVTLQDLTTRWLRREPIDGLGCVVFDDALVGVYRHACPVLAELQTPAALYPLTKGLGKRPPWWPGSARTMTGKEMAELLSLGWEVGSHTQTHRSLPSLSPAELRTEIIDSRDSLQESTGFAISTIAYPFGHHDERVRQTCREAGYDIGFTFLNGRITADLDPFKIPRLTMTMQSRGLRWAYHLTRTADSWPDTQVDEVEGPTPT